MSSQIDSAPVHKLRPWQQRVLETESVINWLYDPKGNTGKSFLATYTHFYGDGKGVWVPWSSSVADMQDTLYKICRTRNLHDPSIIFIRAFECDITGFIAAVKRISRGVLYDTNQPDKLWTIDNPLIWIYSCELPSRMDHDWNLWTIQDLNLKNISV